MQLDLWSWLKRRKKEGLIFPGFLSRCKIRLQAFRPEKRAFFLEVWKLIDDPISAPFCSLQQKTRRELITGKSLPEGFLFWKLAAWSKGGRPEKLLIFSGFQTGCRCRRKLLIFFCFCRNKKAPAGVSRPEAFLIQRWNASMRPPAAIVFFLWASRLENFPSW